MSKLLDLADDLSACVGASATESKIIMRVENALRAEAAKSAEKPVALNHELRETLSATLHFIPATEPELYAAIEDAITVLHSTHPTTTEVEALRAEIDYLKGLSKYLTLFETPVKVFNEREQLRTENAELQAKLEVAR